MNNIEKSQVVIAEGIVKNGFLFIPEKGNDLKTILDGGFKEHNGKKIKIIIEEEN